MQIRGKSKVCANFELLQEEKILAGSNTGNNLDLIRWNNYGITIGNKD